MTQTQREALLDLLHLSIFTDSHLSLKEDEALTAALGNVGWEGKLPREIFLYNSITRARKALESEAATTDYIASRAAAFTDTDGQAAAVGLLKHVMAADGTSESETAFLERVRTHFPQA